MHHHRVLILLAVSLATLRVEPAMAQVIKFDFDSGSPPVHVYQPIPFSITSGGITATFTSPQGVAFSVQSDGTTFFSMSRFSANYLLPSSINRNELDITFSTQLVSISIDFATVDYMNPAEVPGNVSMTARDDLSGTVVGTALKHGEYLGDTYPTGMLTFTSSGATFNHVHLIVPFQPQGTANFLLDNINVSTVVVLPREVSPPNTQSPLYFYTNDNMIWEEAAASNAAAFNLYRGTLFELVQDGIYGACLRPGVPVNQASDPGAPPAGVVWTYLVTARNAYGEGSLGNNSAGSQRANVTPCP